MRIILHSDINNCYASIESIAHPEYKKIPLAVGGDPEKRNGIILAKNEIAKKYGIKTGEALWQAQKKCPSLKIVPPDFPLYQHYCSLVTALYNEYTDLTESFGPDEAWLDVTGSTTLFGSGEAIAQDIRRRVKEELGLTVSIGVSFNKAFAKFGSDYKKPDAVTVITPDNFKEIVWPAPAGDLLFAGPATVKALYRRGIMTIGDIAEFGKENMARALGKNGERLYFYAAGLDTTPVMSINEPFPIKTIGNSFTTPRDMECFRDAKAVLYVLSETVAKRLRDNSLRCEGVQLYIRSASLYSKERQSRLPYPTSLSGEICREALALLKRNWDFSEPLRSIGVRAIYLTPESTPHQLSMWHDESKAEKAEALERTVDKIREKYGRPAIKRAIGTDAIHEEDKPQQLPRRV